MKLETVYGILLLVLAGLFGYFFADGRNLFLMDQALLKVQSAAVFFAFFLSFCLVLMGLKKNVIKEVFDEENQAAANLLAGIAIAIALVVGLK